jgi:fatty-acyl-CoA synthase
VRGPWIVREYYKPEDPITQFTDDGWFRTGDIVTIAPDGCVTITDRSKDVIKSGGEWVSSVALEGALMGHAEVFEAAVVGLPHPRWSERPFGVVVRKPGAQVEQRALKAWLAERFASWWVPDEIVFVDSLPKTGTGKVQKILLREEYRERYASGHAHDSSEHSAGAGA